MGPPGSGKGSLSQLCVKKLGWKQLSTGNLCRKHIAEKTSIGEKIDFAIKSGKLIDDELIIEMVKQWLNESLFKVNGVILDGFPRTIVQAQYLQKLLQESFGGNKLFIAKMNVADSVVIERLAARSICQNNSCQAVYSTLNNSSLRPLDLSKCDECFFPLIRRSDDSQESIKERLIVHYKHEKTLVDFYKENGQLIYEMHVERSIEDIFRDFTNLLGLKTV